MADLESRSRAPMAVVQGIDGLEASLGRLFIVVGVFDGLHRGHEYLLRELVRASEDRAARPAVITFDHHPDEILTGSAPPLLCDPDERLERLQAHGVAVTVVQHFDVALRETPFDTFVRRIAERVDLAGFLMTPESAFGYERRGTPNHIAALGQALGYDVVVVPQFELDGAPVRSTDVRAAIGAGDIERAAALLGRPVTITGNTAAAAAPHVTPLAFPLPVSLPPAGRYAASIAAPAPGPDEPCLVVEAGRVWVEPGLAVPVGTRVAVALRDRLPVAT